MNDHLKENSYKNILKGTSLFGGVQIFQILVNLIRGKFVAIILGPAGMGVSALFTTSAVTIQQLASLGLNLAVVKEVAANKEDLSTLSKIFYTTRRLMFLVALVGATLCAVLSPWLSEWSFGSRDYAPQFLLLSLMVFFAVAGSGELSLLQGLHDVKKLSQASLFGAFVGLFVGVPLYYIFGLDGIVPSMIALSLSTFLFYFFAVRQRFPVGKKKVTNDESLNLTKKLLGLGVVLMAGVMASSGTNWLVAMIVRRFGSVDNVGFYQAANSITNQYAGVVFSAMSLDFFPRLAAVASDNAKIREIVNRQTEVVATIMAPIVTLLVLTAPLVIELLLSKEFASIEPLMRWMGLGVLLRGIVYPMGYITFAKDNKRLYFWLEAVFCNLVILLLSFAFYTRFGLDGLGMAVVGENIVAFVVYYAVNKRMYGFGYSRRTMLIVATVAAIGAASFAGSFVGDAYLSYSVMGATAVLAVAFAWRTIKAMLLRGQ